MDRLAPKSVYVCGFIWEWAYAKHNSPHDTPGAFGGRGGGLGGHTFKCLGNLSTGWTDWYQIWYKSADSPGNGHRLDTIRPSIPHGFGGVTNSKVWGSCQTTGLIGTKFGKRLRIRLGIDIGEIQFASHYPRGHFWGFRGSQIQTFFEAVKRLDQIWHTCADSSRNGYTPNKLPWRHRGGGSWGF